MRTLDISGQRFGRLIAKRSAIRPVHLKNTQQYWECLCDCGRTTLVSSYALRHGHSKSCGCLRGLYIDIANQRFGRLLVTGRGEDWKSRTGNKHIRWNWICDCGTTGRSTGNQLRAGRAKSCGCFKKDPLTAFNNVYSDYTGSARRRGLSFMLSREVFREITSSACYYCGVPPSKTETRAAVATYAYNGIDSTLGYVLDNCVPCCFPCNSAKGILSESDFFSLIQRIYSKHLVVRKSMATGDIPA